MPPAHHPNKFAKVDALLRKARELLDSALNIHVPARSKVFQVPELLEMILSHLPQKDLFVAQRVNRTFYHTIADSKKLQRKLFCTIDSPAEFEAHLKNLRLDPFWLYHKHYHKHTKRGESLVYVDSNFGYRDTERRAIVGWQGRNDVHANGSWRNMAFGAVQGGINRVISSAPRMETYNTSMDGTLGDFVDFLEDLRAKILDARLLR